MASVSEHGYTNSKKYKLVFSTPGADTRTHRPSGRKMSLTLGREAEVGWKPLPDDLASIRDPLLLRSSTIGNMSDYFLFLFFKLVFLLLWAIHRINIVSDELVNLSCNICKL